MRLALGRVVANWDKDRINQSLIHDNVNLEDEVEIDYHIDKLKELSLDMMRESEERRKYRHRKIETKEFYSLSHDYND